MKSIGENLKTIRQLKNYTQEYVAQQLNVSREWYIKLESDQEKPSDKILSLAAKLYNIKIDDIKNFDSKAIFSNIVSGTHNNLNQGYNLYQNEKEINAKEETLSTLREFIESLKIQLKEKDDKIARRDKKIEALIQEIDRLKVLSRKL
jgi:transcriptional regulator with XRE-family HTH domain